MAVYDRIPLLWSHVAETVRMKDQGSLTGHSQVPTADLVDVDEKA